MNAPVEMVSRTRVPSEKVRDIARRPLISSLFHICQDGLHTRTVGNAVLFHICQDGLHSVQYARDNRRECVPISYTLKLLVPSSENVRQGRIFIYKILFALFVTRNTLFINSKPMVVELNYLIYSYP